MTGGSDCASHVLIARMSGEIQPHVALTTVVLRLTTVVLRSTIIDHCVVFTEVLDTLTLVM